MKQYLLLRKGLAVGIILLFIGTAIIPSSAQNIEKMSLPKSRGNTFYVGGSGPGNYSQIQEAIDNASDGDYIYVFSGSYQPITIDKKLSLIGVNVSGESAPLISGGASYDCVLVSADGCCFVNFRVRNGDGGYSKNGVILDSDNNTVSRCLLYDTGCGLKLESASNNTITHNEMTGGWDGIILGGSQSNNNTFLDNYIHSHDQQEVQGGGNGEIWQGNRVSNDSTGNGFAIRGSSRWIFKDNYIASNRRMGIQMSNSENMTLINNTFYGNGFVISGGTISQLTSHIISGNIVNGKPLYYFANKNNMTVPLDAGQIILANCSYCTINAVNISQADTGISLWYSSYNTISSSRINSSLFEEGILLTESHHNVIINNIMSGHSSGIELSNSNNNDIEKNIVQYNDEGILLSGGKENSIVNNQVTSCRIGIDLENSNSSTISHNNISNCSWWGLFLWISSNTCISSNCFFDCGRGIYGSEGNGSRISDNLFSGNNCGIALASSNSEIVRNIFRKNKLGLSISRGGNVVQENNFVKNIFNAFFNDATHTQWKNNYWGRPRLLPYLILGLIVLIYDQYGNPWADIPWVNFDWHPAQKPYDIPGIR